MLPIKPDHFHRLGAVALILGILLLAAGCRRAQTAETIFILFDVSGSTLGQRANYLRDFRKILDCATRTVASGSRTDIRLVADRISENPLAQSEFNINLRLRAQDQLGETALVYQKRLKDALEATLKEAQTILGRPPGPATGTRIMESLRLAERVFATYKANHKILVLFSDMIEQSNRYDFASMELAGKSGTIIGEQRTADELPDLRGVRVYVIGAGAATSGGLRPERLGAISRFWQEYFGGTGADLPKERYGAALLQYEDCGN